MRGTRSIPLLIVKLSTKGGGWTFPFPVALLHRKGLGGPQNQYECFIEKTIYCPCQESKASIFQLFSLSRSHYPNYAALAPCEKIQAKLNYLTPNKMYINIPTS
jgi:hypothetical protein